MLCMYLFQKHKPTNNGFLEINGWLRKTFLWRTEWKVKFCSFYVWREGYLISFNGTYHMIAQMFVEMLVILNWKLYKCYHFLIISSFGAFGCLAYSIEVKKKKIKFFLDRKTILEVTWKILDFTSHPSWAALQGSMRHVSSALLILSIWNT